MRTELDAAGVLDPHLRAAYQRCRELNARYGRTFFLATRLLAPSQRPAVHALYGFARLADDILDDFDPHIDTAERGARLQRLAAQFFGAPRVECQKAATHAGDPVLAAVIHTARAVRHRPRELFDAFLRPCGWT